MPPKHTAWLLEMGVQVLWHTGVMPAATREAAGASLISVHLLTALEGEAGKACGQLPKI